MSKYYRCWIPYIDSKGIILRNGNIRIIKNTIGNDGTFQYTITPQAGNINSFEITTTEGSGSFLIENVFPGTYTINEINQNGWLPVGPNTINSNVSYNSTSIISFTNTSDFGFVIIQKQTSGDDGTFNFITNPLGINASITTIDGTGSTGIYLPSDNYTITETEQIGWTGTVDQNISVTSGSTGSVSFYNTNLGTLIINKEIIGTTGSFDFTITPSANGITGFNITIGTGTTGSYIIADVNVGDYFIEEIGQTGWVASPTGATGVVSAGTTATVDFINTQLGSTGTLVIEKFIVGSTGSTGSFDFTITPPANGVTGFNITIGTGTTGSYIITDVNVGSYFVNELSQPGWIISTISGTGTVSEGGTGTVFYTNIQTGTTGTLVINKEISGSTGSFDFTIEPPANGITGFNITIGTGTTGSYIIPDVNTGNYYISELNQPGWLASPTGTTGTVNIGNTGTVNFFNTQLSGTGTLVINKEIIGSTGATGSFDFTINPAANETTGFNITIGTGTTGSYIIPNVDIGNYFVEEIGQTGWFVSPTGATGIVSAGNTGTVDFINTQFATLSILKIPLGTPTPPNATFNYNISGPGGYTGTASISTVGAIPNGTIISNLVPGTYTISEVSQTGWSFVNPSTGVNIVDAQGVTPAAFINQYTPP